MKIHNPDDCQLTVPYGKSEIRIPPHTTATVIEVPLGKLMGICVKFEQEIKK